MNKSDSNTTTDVANEAMELNRKLINVMLNHSMKESEIFVQHYETQLKMKTQFLADLEDEEPPKFFKSAHRDWEQRKEKGSITLIQIIIPLVLKVWDYGAEQDFQKWHIWSARMILT